MDSDGSRKKTCRKNSNWYVHISHRKIKNCEIEDSWQNKIQSNENRLLVYLKNRFPLYPHLHLLIIDVMVTANVIYLNSNQKHATGDCLKIVSTFNSQ
jgi:hypothetical protein